MTSHIRPALVLLAVMTVLTGLAYPLALTGLSQLIFPSQANGSLVSLGGKVVGSALIGQSFTDPQWFHGRPSATTNADPADATKTVPAPYNAMASGGSNLSPTSKALAERVAADAAALKAENPGTPIPADLLTTSASGLDPHISPAAAMFQVPRIAKARGIDEARLRDLVAANTETPLVGLLGEPRVNVLALNLALAAGK
jgi:K+-transporting ATPase ATPase C chain